MMAPKIGHLDFVYVTDPRTLGLSNDTLIEEIRPAVWMIRCNKEINIGRCIDRYLDRQTDRYARNNPSQQQSKNVFTNIYFTILTDYYQKRKFNSIKCFLILKFSKIPFHHIIKFRKVYFVTSHGLYWLVSISPQPTSETYSSDRKSYIKPKILRFSRQIRTGIKRDGIVENSPLY